MRGGQLPRLALGERSATRDGNLNAFQDALSAAVTSLRRFDALGAEPFAFKAYGLTVNGTSVVASANTPMGGLVGASDQLTFQLQLTGTSNFLSEGRKFRLEPGALIFLPGVERYGDCGTRSLLTVSVNGPKFLAAWDLLLEQEERTPEQMPIDRALSVSLDEAGFPLLDHLLAVCRQIELCGGDGQALDYLGVDDQLHRILALALRRALPGSGPRLRGLEGMRAAVLRRVEEHVAANLDRFISVAELASVAGISVRSLHSHFIAHRGMTPSLRVREMRLEQARQALLDGRDDSTVTDVSYRFGFPTPGAFSAYYRHKYGERPSETRRRKM